MERILIETQFLPSLEFFCAVSQADQIEIEYYEHYVKQSYRNHARICTANGVYKLVVPLVEKGNRTLIRDVKIDYSGNWQINFKRTIESAYRKSPYYEHYADELYDGLFFKPEFLVDLNANLLALCLKWLRWKKEIFHTNQYNKSSELRDFRNDVLSKKHYGLRNFYKAVPYTQVFGGPFVENLSIMDLIFCKGPEATNLIKASSLNL